jgi:hypothetical protein
MSLSDTVMRVRSGLFQIVFFKNDQRIGGGSAFLVNDLLVTNNHVYAGHLKANRVEIRRDDASVTEFIAQEFASKLVTGSDKQSYDYAVLKVPEVLRPNDHQFTLEPRGARRIGDAIALLGFPFEHDNLTCHQGIISSFYRSGIVEVIQVDASVNAGNSGGPLIDPETGVAFGIVTRKETGLSQIFVQLRQTLNTNIEMLQRSGSRALIGTIDLVQATIASQNQMLLTLDEIERQANVGIGYAFSAEHILTERCMQDG